MISAALEAAILKRINRIPIVKTLQIRVVTFDEKNYIILNNLGDC